MTEIEIRAIRALLDVKVPEENWHGARIEKFNTLLTLRSGYPLDWSDRADLWFLVWRYRRQITDREVVAHANEIVNGALHLAF